MTASVIAAARARVFIDMAFSSRLIGSISLKRNEDYHGDKAKLDELIFKVIPDESTRKQELKAGSIDGYDLPNPIDWKSLEDEGVIKVPDSAGTQMGFVGVFLPTAAQNENGELISSFAELRNPYLVMNVFAGDLGRHR